MKASSLFLATLLVSTFALAAEDEGTLCSSWFLDVSEDGKIVELNQQGKRNYRVVSTKTENGQTVITYKPVAFSVAKAAAYVNAEILQSAELGADGRIKRLIYQSKVAGDSQTTYGFDYEKGRCFTRTVGTNKDGIVADVRLCRELKGAIAKAASCAESAMQEVAETIKKYHVNPKLVMLDGAHLGSVAIAGAQIGACESNPFLKRAFNEKELWESAANTAEPKKLRR